jgi:hypothetical protein
MSISTFHDADIGRYGHQVQNVDIDVMARFQMSMLLFREKIHQFRYLQSVCVVAWGGNILPTFECTKNVGSQGPLGTKLP